MKAEYIITTLVGIILTTYGFIFRYVFSKISKIEDRPICNSDVCIDRFNRMEQKQTGLDSIMSRFESVLSRLEAVVEFLQKDYDNRQK